MSAPQDIIKIFSVAIFALFCWICGYYIKEYLKPKEPFRVAISNWVGYLPVVYAKEKMILGDDVELVWTESLKATNSAFKRGLVDGMFATQYDYLKSEQTDGSSMIFATNISKGSDVVMSNISLEELNSSKSVMAVMEGDSVGKVMFDQFLQKYDINSANFIMYDKTQLGIVSSDYSKSKAIVVTYTPFDSILKKKGFLELANSSKLQVLIIDGFFALDSKSEQHKKSIDNIKKAFELSVKMAKDNPYEFYQVIKPYLKGIEFEEFKASLDGIEWVGIDNINKINNTLKSHKIKVAE